MTGTRIGAYPPLRRPDYIIRKPATRTGRCDCCRTVKNRLALYRTDVMLRACRACASGQDFCVAVGASAAWEA
jgi:hypothetical protein